MKLSYYFFYPIMVILYNLSNFVPPDTPSIFDTLLYDSTFVYTKKKYNKHKFLQAKNCSTYSKQIIKNDVGISFCNPTDSRRKLVNRIRSLETKWRAGRRQCVCLCLFIIHNMYEHWKLIKLSLIHSQAEENSNISCATQLKPLGKYDCDRYSIYKKKKR